MKPRTITGTLIPSALKKSRVISGKVMNAASELYLACRDINLKYAAGERFEAKIALKRLLKKHQGSGPVHETHSMILYKENKFEKAYKEINKALLVNPKHPERLNQRGLIERRLNMIEAAIASYKEALNIKPDFPEPYNNLAIIYRFSGDIDLAIKSLKKAIELKPDYFSAIYNLSCVKGFIFNDTEIELIKLYVEKESNKDNIARCYFALYNTYSQAQEYELAFTCLEKGNQAIRSKKAFTSNLKSYVKDMIKLYDKSYFDKAVKAEPYSEKAVFIVGMPRSGSSLLEQILVSHTKVQGLGESESIPKTMFKLNPRFEKDVKGLLTSFAKLSRDDLNIKAKEYRELLKISFDYQKVYTDKALGNYKVIGFIKLLLPKAKFIHIKRNPVDICFGCYEKKFTTGHAYSYDLISLAKHYIHSNTLLTHWKKVFPDDIYTVQYEELVANPEKEVKKCLEFLGLEMETSCLEFHKSERDVFTASTEQVREKITTKSVEKWKRYQSQLQGVVAELKQAGIEVQE